MGRARFRGWQGAVAVMVAVAPGTRALAEDLDLSIKAAYLYKFAPFVEWPPSVFDSPLAPVTICILGRDPFGPMLDHAVQGKSRGQRPLQVRRLAAGDSAARCQILYVGGANPRAVADALHGVEGAPILTVTDDQQDPRSKGIVNLVTRANRVRFEIDEAAAARAGVTLSGKLLGLAVEVRRAKEQRP
jgi:hypothetical protein